MKTKASPDIAMCPLGVQNHPWSRPTMLECLAILFTMVFIPTAPCSNPQGQGLAHGRH